MRRGCRRIPFHAILLPLAGLVLLTSPAPLLAQQAALPFRNPELPVDVRADDLIGRLTLEEKAGLMIERAQPVERLGIPAFPWWNEALHGVARTGRATVFPQAIGLSATFDADLMQRVATAVSDEARAMNNRWVKRGKRHIFQGLVFWSPNINIVRDPRWGRGQETYGEDPFLTGTMGTAFVKGMQGDDPRYLKVVATAKHYAVHSGPEALRHTFDASVSEIDLRETYLPAFRDLVVHGKAESVMCAYNAFRAQPACASEELIGRILRKEWAFGGYVVSDCGAVVDVYATHKVRDTPVEAAAFALLGGTDLECGVGSGAPGHPDMFSHLPEAVSRGLLKETDVDRALRRLLRSQMRLGVYDPPERLPWANLTFENTVDAPPHRALAREAATKSLVLLKNENGTLPLRKDLGHVAVIGPNARDLSVLLGNYHGTPVAPVTILDGIKAAAGTRTKVTYARGAPVATGLPDLEVVPASALSHVMDGKAKPGLRADYYAGHFDGAPVLSRTDASVDFDWADGSPAPGLDDDRFSVRWLGQITAPVTGRYRLGLRCATMCRVLVDDRPVAQGRFDYEVTPVSGVIRLMAGRTYPLRVELLHQKYDAVVQLLWEVPGGRGDEMAEAVAAASAADAVVMVLGLNPLLEGEEMNVPVEGFSGGDRTSLDLPRVQQELMERVTLAARGKPVVLVLTSGSALSVKWADENLPAILQAWYAGQSAGTAVADVLFGDASPGGRLPVTFYRSVDQLPDFTNYSMKGRTYRYFAGAPLYPFGHGLSYSRFTYANLTLPRSVTAGSPVPVSVDVRNTGSVAADEVVQMYVLPRDPASTAAPRALKGFQRVSLRPGEQRTVTFTLDDRALSSVSADGQRAVRPGRYTIAVGGKQPFLKGTADAATTMVVTGDVEVTGAAKALDP